MLLRYAFGRSPTLLLPDTVHNRSGPLLHQTIVGEFFKVGSLTGTTLRKPTLPHPRSVIKSTISSRGLRVTCIANTAEFSTESWKHSLAIIRSRGCRRLHLTKWKFRYLGLVMRPPHSVQSELFDNPSVTPAPGRHSHRCVLRLRAVFY